jgi:hypothetical protein
MICHFPIDPRTFLDVSNHCCETGTLRTNGLLPLCFREVISWCVLNPSSILSRLAVPRALKISVPNSTSHFWFMTSPLLLRRLLANRRPTDREEQRLRRALEDDLQQAEVLQVRQVLHEGECRSLSTDVERLVRCAVALQQRTRSTSSLLSCVVRLQESASSHILVHQGTGAILRPHYPDLGSGVDKYETIDDCALGFLSSVQEDLEYEERCLKELERLLHEKETVLEIAREEAERCAARLRDIENSIQERKRGVLNPIRWVPVEVLNYIFLDVYHAEVRDAQTKALESDQHWVIRTPFVLSSVCQLWRETVECLGSALWHTFTAPMGNSRPELNYWNRCKEKSKQVPLSVAAWPTSLTFLRELPAERLDHLHLYFDGFFSVPSPPRLTMTYLRRARHASHYLSSRVLANTQELTCQHFLPTLSEPQLSLTHLSLILPSGQVPDLPTLLRNLPNLLHIALRMEAYELPGVVPGILYSHNALVSLELSPLTFDYMVQCLQRVRFPNLCSLSITHIPPDFSQATYGPLVDQENIMRVASITLSGATRIHPSQNTTSGENEDDEEPDENEIHSFLRAFTWLYALQLRGSAVRMGLKALELDLSLVEALELIPIPLNELIIRDSDVKKEVVEQYERKRGELVAVIDEGGDCAPLRVVYHNCWNIPG